MNLSEKLVAKAKERRLREWAFDAAVLGSAALNATLLRDLYRKLRKDREDKEV